MIPKLLSAVGLTAALVLVSGAPALAETVEVTGSALNVRTGPGSSYSRFLVIYRGRRYEVVGRSASWVKIRVGSREGWSYGRYLRTVPGGGRATPPPSNPAAGGTPMKVAAGVLNVRSGPGTQYRRLNRLTRGTQVSVIRSSGVWRQIALQGRLGWVHGAYLAPIGSPAPRASGPRAWDRLAPAADYRRTTYRGVRVNRRTVELVLRAERIMADLGRPGFRFVFTQGSYSGAVSASGGTHSGGGALDIRTRGQSRATVDAMVRALRRAGFAAWSRGRGADSFAPHIHAIAIGDREATSAARSQVRSYGNGRNGLRNQALDPDRGLGRDAPAWARRFF